MLRFFRRKHQIVDDGSHEKIAAIKKMNETSEKIRIQLAELRESLATDQDDHPASQMS